MNHIKSARHQKGLDTDDRLNPRVVQAISFCYAILQKLSDTVVYQVLTFILSIEFGIMYDLMQLMIYFPSSPKNK